MDIEKRRNVLLAARQAFFRYGYRRITMKELAEVAGISRTALYMEFEDKTAVLNAMILVHAEDLLREIAQSIDTKKKTEEKLLFIFEIWSIRTFDSLHGSPEAREIMEGGLTFAKESYTKAYSLLEEYITIILKAHFKKPDARKILSAEKTARQLVACSRGLKLIAKDSMELRKLFQENINLILSN